MNTQKNLYHKDKKNTQWWSEEYGFFGDFYLEGDDSKEGYLQSKKQTLSERTNEEVGGIMQLCGLQRKEKILDVPCGYGRHSIALAKKGYIVVGVDLNKTFLDTAIDHVKKAGVRAEFKRGDMRHIAYRGDFDVVVNMFYSFGFFITEKENLLVLKNFYHALKKGGRLLFHTDVNVPRVLHGLYKGDATRILQSGKRLRVIDRYDPLTKRMNGTWMIGEGAQYVRKHYSVRVYTKEEFEGMCKEIGFVDVIAYGNWSGERYSDRSEDMIIVARK